MKVPVGVNNQMRIFSTELSRCARCRRHLRRETRTSRWMQNTVVSFSQGAHTVEGVSWYLCSVQTCLFASIRSMLRCSSFHRNQQLRKCLFSAAGQKRNTSGLTEESCVFLTEAICNEMEEEIGQNHSMEISSTDKRYSMLHNPHAKRTQGILKFVRSSLAVRCQ